MKRPRLNMLRTFEVAGRRLSFSLAAAELNITQAAVSQQIRNLEAYLDCPLFIRKHRQLALSGTGLAYLDAVHEALDRLDTVTDQLFPDRASQIVTIRCTSSIATLWLAPQIGAFRKANPQIDLRIHTLDQDLAAGQTRGADLEIFIADAVPDIAAKDGQIQKLLTSTIMPVAAPDLFADRAGPHNPSDIMDFQLIHVLGYADDWHRWFRRHGLDNVAVPHGLMVDGSLIALEAALRGDGVVLGRRPFIDAHLQSGRLREVFSQPRHLAADYYLRRSGTNAGRRSNDQVARWLLDMAVSGQPPR
jgi:LysR family transcriptional regulator, glycine cleavage system transcriptional activator